jgi:hypothetical protein
VPTAGQAWLAVAMAAPPTSAVIWAAPEASRPIRFQRLLVVLCSEQATQQVVNTGSLYQ